MKSYTITVNGNVYDVTVEEGTGAACSGSSTEGSSESSTEGSSGSQAAAPAAGGAGCCKGNRFRCRVRYWQGRGKRWTGCKEGR